MYAAARQKIEELWYACVDGDVDRVKAVLGKGHHDVNGLNYWQTDIDPGGWRRTPLHVAVLHGHAELARFLLSEGADVNARTKYGDTPLHFAVQGGDAGMVRLLRAHGADAAIKNDDGETPLDLATKAGATDVLSALGDPPS